MEIMIETQYPFGSINRVLVQYVTKSPRGIYYLIDDVYNYARITESVFNQCIADGIPYIETVRKGV